MTNSRQKINYKNETKIKCIKTFAKLNKNQSQLITKKMYNTQYN